MTPLPSGGDPVCILIVEDDAAIVRLLERSLRAQGYQVVSVRSGEAALQVVAEGTVDLIVLDIALPGRLDGHQVLRAVRALDEILPVLMLTARHETRSKVTAFDSGADDYLTKPFDLEELLARIRALLRRRASLQPEAAQAVLQAGDLVVDPLSYRAWRGAEPLDLSAREFTLLVYLMRNPGRVLSREQILSAVWGYGFDPQSNIVDVYVGYLRRKIDRPGEPSLITTIRGVGYRFDPPSPA